MERWDGWYAHVIEHHMALLQHRVGAGAHVGEQALNALIVLIMFYFWNKLIAVLVSWGPLLLLVLIRLALPSAEIAFGFYVLRVLRYPWLRREWCDFLHQFKTRAIGDHVAPAEVQCPICADNVPATPWHITALPCCNKTICWPCVRRHAESVVEEARPEMVCPLAGCKPLADTFVLSAIRREQWSWSTLDVTGSRARRKRRHYERWVLSCGLAAACAARAEDVVHCSTEDCGHMWVLPTELRRRKSDAEPRSNWNPRSWAVGRIVGLYTPVTENGQDIRFVNCPKCRADFCLLCGQPWGSRRSNHAGKSCVEHGKHQPERCSGDVRWTGAKLCPGCGIPILRSWGCNHMTCTQCRAEWCWVCLDQWSVAHYSCMPDTSANHLQPCSVQ